MTVGELKIQIFLLTSFINDLYFALFCIHLSEIVFKICIASSFCNNFQFAIATKKHDQIIPKRHNYNLSHLWCVWLKCVLGASCKITFVSFVTLLRQFLMLFCIKWSVAQVLKKYQRGKKEQQYSSSERKENKIKISECKIQKIAWEMLMKL